MKKSEKKLAIIEILEEIEEEQLVKKYDEYCNENNDFEDYIFPMDRFDEACGNGNGYWVACRVVYGDFNPMDDYFIIDAYGNFKSMDAFHAKQEYIDIQEMANYAVENDYDFDDDDIRSILDENED